MKLSDFHTQIALDEDSSRQFKADVKNADSLASEMAALPTRVAWLYPVTLTRQVTL
ncbi:hypothetical protein [Desulfobulbus alkaliphilus]|uniref:hypothetical protein n=1 Tax=Desulfobulbus alkaliphilus TaxID=869814 RepID=UPI00196668FD|nr:hypothetical protein [Desulfobulbus alkaliphilus]